MVAELVEGEVARPEETEDHEHGLGPMRNSTHR